MACSTQNGSLEGFSELERKTSRDILEHNIIFYDEYFAVFRSGVDQKLANLVV